MKEKLEEVKILDELVRSGQEFVFGPLSYTEEEIIEFAKRGDALWIHVDRERAAKGPWKGIIASGPMLLTMFHHHFWVPRFGDSVIAGKGINNWSYFKPHYPDQEVICRLSITEITKSKYPETAEILWTYKFHNQDTDELMQTCEYHVIHQLNRKVVP